MVFEVALHEKTERQKDMDFTLVLLDLQSLLLKMLRFVADFYKDQCLKAYCSISCDFGKHWSF